MNFYDYNIECVEDTYLNKDNTTADALAITSQSKGRLNTTGGFFYFSKKTP